MTGGQGDTVIEIVPVEYKRGKMGKWLNDHVQLCAQALCLEERLASVEQSSLVPSAPLRTSGGRSSGSGKIEKGYLFYFGSRRREEVTFTPELRARTEAAVLRAFELVTAGAMPLPVDKRAKCRDCSLEPVCLPFESEVWAGRAVPRRRGGDKVTR